MQRQTPQRAVPDGSAPRFVATPWGRAKVVESVTLRQQAGDKRFSSVVELLEGDRGELLVRFAYTTDGVVRRGPVTMRARDLERLHRDLAAAPVLASALGLGDA
jgi:hypothetical protein